MLHITVTSASGRNYSLSYTFEHVYNADLNRHITMCFATTPDLEMFNSDADGERERGPSWKRWPYATAVTHPNDKYDRKYGNKLAFSRVIRYFFDKNVRTLFMKEYLKKHGGIRMKGICQTITV